MKNSRYVTDWWIKHHKESDIYEVTFNLTERWLRYHQMNDELYIFGEDKEDESGNIDIEDWQDRFQEIPEFLPKNKSYVPTVIQNKEQISFYFIPVRKLMNGELIKESSKR